MIITIPVSIVVLLIGILAGYILRKSLGEKAIGSAEQKARNIILDAENKAETLKKEIAIEAKEEAHRMRSEIEREIETEGQKYKKTKKD